ncbi:Translin [Delitschia confertaspora ATCC 74209]|uniref:Translin n=1 Tax=Delitschia confertaspora ATCC 74209 TaxID=1513339 RepID=A0A9P4JIA2_9PLEO|nr:Translin [Delitschia confertaspora ATCC 74209]
MGEESQPQSASPFISMFEGFRKELDEHHDRRERIIKASRDITAASKKIIFSLQRVRKVGEKLPGFVLKTNTQYWEIIENQYKAISTDLQGLNAYRYGRNITGGNQEFMEALSFQHYLETQQLISFEESEKRIASMSGEAGPVMLSPEDYILGIFDMVGELMRFSITSIATNGKLPAGTSESQDRPSKKAKTEESGDQMEIDEQLPPQTPTQHRPRDVLSDLRELRLQLEMFEPPQGSNFSRDVDKKMDVMKQCVEKVETALYGLIVRGSERPKGWVPDMGDSRKGAEIESY